MELEKLVGAIGGYYVCEGVNLAHLLEPEFMNSFVRNGALLPPSLPLIELTPCYSLQAV